MKFKLPEWLRKEIKIPVKPRRIPRVWERRISKGFGILFLLLLFCFVIWRVQLYFELNQRFKTIRDAGLPTSGQELNDWHPVMDAENGALVLTQAVALLQTFPDGRAKEVVEPRLLKRTNQWSTEISALVGKYALMNTNASIKAQEAFHFSRFRYPADFSYGPDTELPHIRKFMELARIGALRAALAVEKEHSDEWPEHVSFMLNLATALNDEPVLLSHLVRNSIIRMAADVAERSLNRINPGDEACRKLQEEFTMPGRTNMLPLAFVGERAIMIPPFRMSWSEIKSLSAKEDGESLPRKPRRYSGQPSTILWLSGIFERDLNFYLQTMETGISLAELPPPHYLKLTNHFEKASVLARKRHYLFSSMLFPTFSKIVLRESSTQADLDLARTALAIERFRLRRGALPENLDDLIPEFMDAVPMDPFDGSPVRYRRLVSGFVVYSVDTDGHDDGGRETPEAKKPTDTNSYDITFTVER